MRRILKEPLLHFLVLGGVFFLVFGLVLSSLIFFALTRFFYVDLG